MSHSSWYTLEAVGTETATSDLGNFPVVGTAQVWAFIFPSFLFIHSHLEPFSPLSFSDWLMWRARFSLGRTLRHKSSLNTLESFIASPEALGERTKDKARPSENMTSVCTAACHLTSRFVLLPSVGIQWHNDGRERERGLCCWRRRKLISKASEVNFNLWCIPERRQIRLNLYKKLRVSTDNFTVSKKQEGFLCYWSSASPIHLYEAFQSLNSKFTTFWLSFPCKMHNGKK